MAKSNKNLSGVVNQLSRATRNTKGMGKLLSPTDLVSPTGGATEKASKPGISGDAKALSMGAKSTPASIKFGAPSSTTTTAPQSGSEWTKLLKQTASGGIASVLSGGLSSIGGLGSLISGIVSLFEGGSGKKVPAPLVKFSLPASQQQTVYIGSKGSTVYQGNVTEQGSASRPTNGIYGAGGQANSAIVGEQSTQQQSAQIVQAVKNALLNSSSLNDVIAEI